MLTLLTTMLRFHKKYLLFVLFCASCKEAIVHDLDEVKANQIKLALEINEIEAIKERQSAHWQISVDSTDVKKALAVIEKSRILSRDIDRFKEQSKSILQSREEKKHLREKELAWYLEETLERYNGILEARVHLNLEEGSDFKPQNTAAQTSSVLLLVKEKTEIKEAEIKQIVFGASGIMPEKISIIISTQGPVSVNSLDRSSKSNYLYYFLSIIILVCLLIISFQFKKLARQRKKTSDNTIKESVDEEVEIGSMKLVF